LGQPLTLPNGAAKLRAMSGYVLGGDPAEIARLDAQAGMLERASRLLLRAAGLAPGMRVLDLGCGLGHLCGIAAELVGPLGNVVGVDASPQHLAVAESRRKAGNVRFVDADVVAYRDAEPFDAVIGRLILFHLPDPVAVLRHHFGSLKAGGLIAMLDFDIGGSRSSPALPLPTQLLDWVYRAFSSAGAHPDIGSRLGPLFREAGVAEVQTFGVQEYLPPGDPRGVGLLAGIVRSLAPQMIEAGIATADQLGLETLAARLGEAVRSADAVILPPTLAVAWGRRQ
jgi:ubiquinone/menaquinone biosynthesis C-methylase UbiE